MKAGILCSNVKFDKHICDYFEIPVEKRKEVLEKAVALRKSGMSDQDFWTIVKEFLSEANDK